MQVGVVALEAVGRVAADVRDGRFRGKVYTFDLASGVVDLRLNPELADKVSASAEEVMTLARRGVLDGRVELEHFGADSPD